MGERRRDVVALDGVSFSIDRGRIFGLVGESGSGKTTCGRLIVGLEKFDSGRILLTGTDISTLKGKAFKQYRRQVQMVFQDPYQSLNPQLTSLDSVAEPLITGKVCPAREREQRVMDILAAVGLSPPEDFIDRFPHQLSGGQRQRVAIARAMVTDPSLVVADEPTSMLDASYSAHIFDILLGVRRELGSTILFITHSLAAARYLCDRIGVIYRGHMMELGPAGEVINSPRHPYTQALIDATPKFGHTADPDRYGTLLAAERPAAGEAGCAFFRRCQTARRTTCGRQAPPWVTIGADHFVACHFAGAPPRGDSGGEALVRGGHA